MKRVIAAGLLMFTGCSTAPLADLLDRTHPGQLEPGGGRDPFRGGVAPPVEPIPFDPPPLELGPPVAPPPDPIEPDAFWSTP
jgi:hypothetical protein